MPNNELPPDEPIPDKADLLRYYARALGPADRGSELWQLTEALACSGSGLVIEAVFAVADEDTPPEMLVYAVDRTEFEEALLRFLREQAGPALHVGNFLAALAAQGLPGATLEPLTDTDDRALTEGLAGSFAAYLRGGSAAIWEYGAVHIGPLLLPKDAAPPDKRGDLSPLVAATVRSCMAEPEDFPFLKVLGSPD